MYDLENPGMPYVPVAPTGTNFIPQYYLYRAKVMIPLSVTGTFTTPGQPIRIGVQGATGARGPTGPTGPTGDTGPQGKGFKNISLSNGILTLTW